LRHPGLGRSEGFDFISDHWARVPLPRSRVQDRFTQVQPLRLALPSLPQSYGSRQGLMFSPLLFRNHPPHQIGLIRGR
jgi:hypothetical protein